jgi:uncharacterized protein
VLAVGLRNGEDVLFTVSEQQGAVSFAVHVKPRSSRDEVIGTHGEAMALRITAPPVDGAANEAICRFFAKALRVPVSSVEIVGGQTGKVKILKVFGVSTQAVLALLPG